MKGFKLIGKNQRQILDLLANTPQGMRPKEISKKTRASSSSVSYSLKALVKRCVLEREEVERIKHEKGKSPIIYKLPSNLRAYVEVKHRDKKKKFLNKI